MKPQTVRPGGKPADRTVLRVCARSGRLNLPRSPVLSWATFSGPRRTDSPSITDQAPVVFTTSGRAAILHALVIAGVGRGDRVLVPSYHCPTMISPIAGIGAQPIFYPIDAGGGARLDYLEDIGAGAKAIIAAHFFGLPQRMRDMREFCDRRGIFMIEDCAHAFFGETEGRPVGHWGDVGIASLPKFFPLPEGGCLVSRRHELAPALRGRGASAEIKAVINVLELGAQYRGLPGLNTAINGALATARWLRSLAARRHGERNGGTDDGDFAFDRAAADAAITKAAKWLFKAAHRDRIVRIRRRNYAAMADLFSDLRGGRALFPVLPGQSIPYVFPLWVDSPEESYQVLRSRGAPVYRWDRLWPGTPDLPGDAGKAWSHHIFQLACHQDLREDDLKGLADTVRSALG